MAAFIRACSRRLVSDGCRIGNFTDTRKTKWLFRNIGCQSRPRARVFHSGKAPIVSTVFITDDDEFHQCLIGAQFVGNKGENIQKIQTEIGSDVALAMYKQHARVSGSDFEEVNRAVEIVLKEVQRLRDLQLKDGFIKEKVFTDDDVSIHQKICGHLFGKGKQKMKMFTSSTGMKFEVIATKERYIFVTGNDAEVVKITTKVLKQHITKIRNSVAIE